MVGPDRDMTENTNLGVIILVIAHVCRSQWCRTLDHAVAGVCDAIHVGESVSFDTCATGIRELRQQGAGGHGFHELASAAGAANRKSIHDCAFCETQRRLETFQPTVVLSITAMVLARHFGVIQAFNAPISMLLFYRFIYCQAYVHLPVSGKIACLIPCCWNLQLPGVVGSSRSWPAIAA
jgi:hypothetical protein